jgi:LysR family glycine cleavage system transcriptional activator
LNRPRLPPLNALRAFEAAARHRRIKDAAAELFVTPAAVSHQVRHLERWVGHKLFDRQGNTLALTPHGERLFPMLKDSLDRIASAVADLHRDGHALTLSVTPAFATRLLVPRLAELRAAEPDLVLTVMATDRVLDLRKAEADVAVRYGAERARPHRSQVLYRDQYLALASPEWRARHPAHGTLPHTDLLGFTWHNPGLLGPTWTRWFASAGLPVPGPTTSFTEESHAIQAAVAGAGVVLASSVLAGPDLRAGRLVQVHEHVLPGLAFHAEFVADHPQRAAIDRVVAWLAGLA